MNDTLLIYYSFEGNTEFVAKTLTEKLKVDVERLQVTNEPPHSGLGKFLRGGKSALMQEDPGLKPVTANVKDYYDIIIAFPVWAGSYPPAIGAFLEANPFTGRNVYLIGCSASGNASGAFDKLTRKLQGNTILGTLSLKNPLKNQDETRERIREFAARRN